MLILRIRQAEVATSAGRLDEAFELATRDGGRFRSHRRGQEAITRIVAGLVLRGREHLAAGRLVQAAADCERAGRLGGASQADVATLSADLREAQASQQRAQRDAALALAAAKRYVEDGALSIGRRVLATAAIGNDSRAKRLMTDIDDQRARLDAALAAAQSAVARRDWNAAAEAVARARSIAPSDARIAEHADVIADALSREAREQFEAGRLDRAAEAAETLQLADPDSVVARDINRALEHCRSATTCLDFAKPRDAAERLRRVAVLFPNAPWLKDVLQHVDAIADGMDHLRTGPLSLATEVAAPIIHDVPRLARPAVPSPARRDGTVGQAHRGPAGVRPERFIRNVDGAGAFLVVRNPVVKVGPISSSALPDVALVADATAPAISIERREDDYFLRAPSPVALNDKPTTEGLLGNNDRIGLSPRCRFTFALPHAASTTAVLDLVGARYPRGDVRRVILLDRDLVLGPGPTSHVRVPGLMSPVVLNLRTGVLRPSVEAIAEGRPLGRDAGIPFGVPVSAGGASFVISRV
jgi:tetratricopeptide (TPR) repeat protein